MLKSELAVELWQISYVSQIVLNLVVVLNHEVEKLLYSSTKFP